MPRVAGCRIVYFGDRFPQKLCIAGRNVEPGEVSVDGVGPMRCPGQDWRYWKDEVVYEAPCPKCDAAVEFFKDESSGRCPRCGHRFKSPKVSFDCARWCAFAEECLGFVPQRESAPDPGEGALASRLIRAVKEDSGADQARIAHALAAFRHARELLSAEGGDPRIILAAVLLFDIGRDERGGPAKAKPILQGVGLDPDTIDCVCHVIDGHRLGKDLDTIEFKIASDADSLARLAEENVSGSLDEGQQTIENGLKTHSARQRARRLLGRA